MKIKSLTIIMAMLLMLLSVAFISASPPPPASLQPTNIGISAEKSVVLSHSVAVGNFDFSQFEQKFARTAVFGASLTANSPALVSRNKLFTGQGKFYEHLELESAEKLTFNPVQINSRLRSEPDFVPIN